MESLVSVIIPVYNVKPYLQRCIYSVIKQSYRNLEIIIVDDGSTDGSSEVCESFLHIDCRIKVYHKSNGGLSDSRNFGISKAKGEYFLFIDSDDIIHEKFCEVLLQNMVDSRADIVSTNLVTFYDDADIEKYNNSDSNTRIQEYDRLQALAEYLQPSNGRKIYHGLCMKMYKRYLFDELKFEVGRLHEDLYITYRLLDKINKLVYIDLPYYYYFKKNSNSICFNYTAKNLNDEYDAVTEMYSYLENNKVLLNELIAFCSVHYSYLIVRSYDVEKKEHILQLIKSMRDWIKTNLWKCNTLNTIQKVKIILKSNFTELYFILRNLKMFLYGKFIH